MSAQPKEELKPLKLDLGCGKNKRDGFIGVDCIKFDGVDEIINLVERYSGEEIEFRDFTGAVEIDGINPPEKLEGRALVRRLDRRDQFKPWPWDSDSVDEVYSSHFVEHLTGAERVHFFNELYRVMKKGANAQIITPDWSNACAYGDPTHQWPPMSGWYPLYLLKSWREANAPHVGYTCDFDFNVAGSWDEWLQSRGLEVRMFAMQRYINSQRDLIVTLTKR